MVEVCLLRFQEARKTENSVASGWVSHAPPRGAKAILKSRKVPRGDSVPPDVDPDTVRWIPANHPFATTVSDIDQDLAQNNVYQKQGVPFRIRSMQKKLEALRNEEKLNNLVIDSQNARNFQRPYKFSGKLKDDYDVQENHTGNSSSEETQKS